MKVFKVKSIYVAFDEDESMVITAETADRALELAKNNWTFREGKDVKRIAFHVEEMDLSKEQIIEVAHYGN